MEIRFPHIEHQIYPRTFLKDVHIVFGYDPVAPSEKLATEVGDFCKKHFGLDNIDKERTMEGGISIFSEDISVRFSFGWDECLLVMRTPAYKSFGFSKPFLEIVMEYFNIIGVGEVKSVTMWKYNELEYELRGEGNAAVVLKGVFSDELLKDNLTVEDEKAMQSLTRWEKTVACNGVDDKQSLLSFEFGFKSMKPDQLKGVVTLKTLIMSSDGAVAVKEIDHLLASFNSTLDDAFHWSVGNDIINEMKKES